MANVVVDVTSFPTVQTISNLVRSDIRDDIPGATDTVGEGQILVTPRPPASRWRISSIQPCPTLPQTAHRGRHDADCRQLDPLQHAADERAARVPRWPTLRW